MTNLVSIVPDRPQLQMHCRPAAVTECTAMHMAIQAFRQAGRRPCGHSCCHDAILRACWHAAGHTAGHACWHASMNAAGHTAGHAVMRWRHGLNGPCSLWCRGYSYVLNEWQEKRKSFSKRISPADWLDVWCRTAGQACAACRGDIRFRCSGRAQRRAVTERGHDGKLHF